MMERLLAAGALQKLAARAGYFRLDAAMSATAAKRAAQQVHSFFLQAILAHYDIDCVVDAGANQGQFAAALRSDGYRGAIVSFEPAQQQFEILRQHSRGDQNWHVRQEALGAKEERRDLRVMRRPAFSSFLDPAQNQPQESLGRNEVEHVENVSIRRLDAIAPEIPSLKNARRLLLKMDTQGFDLEVFAGASGILDRVAALQSELSLTPLYQGMPHFTEALATFEAAGFRVCSIAPVVRDASTLALIECDCLMLRTATLPAAAPVATPES
ncbi:MAG: FkbM family methyltransferase [Terriglobales bacterium]